MGAGSSQVRRGSPKLNVIRVVRLGTPRKRNEGPRIGTVRRPPRGVPKSEFAKRDFYDVWLPLLSPSAELIAEAMAIETPAQWKRFASAFRKQLHETGADRVIDTLAELSHTSNFSIGCYCEDESGCHRSILRELLTERNADLA
jgi:uncharacterized protein YeaO (DUF488 family)